MAKVVSEEKLIRAVSERQFLYDLSHVDYRNVKVKENAWTKISETANEEELNTGNASENKTIHYLCFICSFNCLYTTK